MSVVAELKELKHYLGTWNAVHSVIEIDSRYLRKLVRDMGRAEKLSEQTKRRIKLGLKRYSQFPLENDFLKQSREHLTELKSRPGSKELKYYILVLDKFLSVTNIDRDEYRIEVMYMRVLVEMAKALQCGDDDGWFGGVDGAALALQRAEGFAESGYKLADAYKNCCEAAEYDRICRLQAFLFINWMQILQEQTKAGHCDKDGCIRSRSELAAIFQRMNAFHILRGIVSDYPYLWQAMYNGLEQASYVEKYKYALYFYLKLVELDKNFMNFDYPPGEVLPISKEAGMVYFVKRFKAFRKDVH